MEDLTNQIKETTLDNLTLSKDVYDENTVFVVVHGIKYLTSALGFGITLQDYNDKNSNVIKRAHLSMSSANYAVVQRHKNLNDYIKPE